MANEKIFTPNDLKQLQTLIQPSFLQQHLKQENDKIYVSKLWLKDLETIIFDEEGFLFSQISSDFISRCLDDTQKQTLLKETASVIIDLYDFFSSNYLNKDYENWLNYFLYYINLLNEFFDLNDLYNENLNRFNLSINNDEIKILIKEKQEYFLCDFLGNLTIESKIKFVNYLFFNKDKSILDNNPEIKDKLKMYGIDLDQEIKKKENVENEIHKSTSLDVTNNLKHNKIISFFKKCFKFND